MTPGVFPCLARGYEGRRLNIPLYIPDAVGCAPDRGRARRGGTVERPAASPADVAAVKPADLLDRQFATHAAATTRLTIEAGTNSASSTKPGALQLREDRASEDNERRL